jgi:hypothetical protein
MFTMYLYVVFCSWGIPSRFAFSGEYRCYFPGTIVFMQSICQMCVQANLQVGEISDAHVGRVNTFLVYYAGLLKFSLKISTFIFYQTGIVSIVDIFSRKFEVFQKIFSVDFNYSNELFLRVILRKL